MARRSGFQSKKDPFKDLDDDFKTTISGATEDEIKKKLSQVTLNQEALLEARENDQDYQEKKEAYSIAGVVYREGTKANKLRVKFCRMILSNRGKETGSFEQN